MRTISIAEGYNIFTIHSKNFIYAVALAFFIINEIVVISLRMFDLFLFFKFWTVHVLLCVREKFHNLATKTVFTKLVPAKLFLLYRNDTFHHSSVVNNSINMKIIWNYLKLIIQFTECFKFSKFSKFCKNYLLEFP